MANITIAGLASGTDLSDDDLFVFYENNDFDSRSTTLSGIMGKANSLRTLEPVVGQQIISYHRTDGEYKGTILGTGLSISNAATGIPNTLSLAGISLTSLATIPAYTILGNSTTGTTSVTTIAAGASTVLKRGTSGGITFAKVKGTDIDSLTIASGNIADNAVTNAKIGAGAVNGAKIANESINSDHYVDGSIDSAHLNRTSGAEAVITTAIRNGAVTNSKLGAGAVDGAKIANESINSDHYVDGSIDSAHLNQTSGAEAVITGTIRNGAVTNSKIGTDAVGNAQIANNAVTAIKIKNGEVTWDKLSTAAKANVRQELVYMQLVPKDEVITTGIKAYFFLPSHMAGRKVVKSGAGMAYDAGGTVTIVFENNIGGDKFTQTSTAITGTETTQSYVFTTTVGYRYQINITGAGTAGCKGLDFWFVVGDA